MTSRTSDLRRFFLVFTAVLTFLAPLLGAETPRAVPPEGVAPFDPKPLMDKVAERVQTDKYCFAVLGDVKHATTFPALVKFMDEEFKPDFVLSTGDMVRGGGGQSGPGYWARFAKDSGNVMRERPWWPVIGNHELAGTPAHRTFHEDDPDEDEPPPGVDGLANFKHFYGLEREYYAVNFRNAVFLALPFPLPKGESEKWLKEELKKASAADKHIFIFNHVPFYTIGQKPKSQVPNKETGITELFGKYHVRAVFSGHDHTYYRTIRGGVPYVISAGGGATIYPGKRLAEALHDDVYYCAVPSSWKAPPTKERDEYMTIPAKAKYICHNGATGWPDKLADKPDQFVVIVNVDGPKVSLLCVTAKGEKFDEMVLAR